jgi:holo-[acyl-carrier protein] synthase
MEIQAIGIDIVEVKRIEKSIKKWGDHFLKHVFTDNEIAYSKKYKYPYEHLAGRFAAKEAIYKALGHKDLGWKDMEIINDKDGKPFCRFTKKKFPKTVLISLSHSEHYAVANAVVTSK